MRLLCRELLLPPKREWSRPPADVNHNKASLIPALWWRVVGNFVRPNTNFQMSRCSYRVAFLNDEVELCARPPSRENEFRTGVLRPGHMAGFFGVTLLVT